MRFTHCTEFEKKLFNVAPKDRAFDFLQLGQQPGQLGMPPQIAQELGGELRAPALDDEHPIGMKFHVFFLSTPRPAEREEPWDFVAARTTD
jgi:hypothetical protein